jgi:hypothetical protein
MKLIVDGHNIIHQWPELNTLAKVNIASAMQKLIDIMIEYYNVVGIDIDIVFDGYPKPELMLNGLGGHIRVFFSYDTTADAFIERMVYQATNPHEIIVATSDYVQQRIIFGQGAFRMPASELYNLIKLMVEDTKDWRDSHRQNITLADHLPDEVILRLKDIVNKKRKES